MYEEDYDRIKRILVDWSYLNSLEGQFGVEVKREIDSYLTKKNLVEYIIHETRNNAAVTTIDLAWDLLNKMYPTYVKEIDVTLAKIFRRALVDVQNKTEFKKRKFKKDV